MRGVRIADARIRGEPASQAGCPRRGVPDSAAASQRAHERFRTLVQATPMTVISSDVDGRVTAWNPAAERIFGWPADEVIGKLPHINDKEKERVELREKTSAGEVTVGLETARVNRRGVRFPASISTVPFQNEEGTVERAGSGDRGYFGAQGHRTGIMPKERGAHRVTRALTDFLDTGNWSGASHHLLSFVVRETQSECCRGTNKK
jgi:PAS domain S-box-containing protein